MINAFAVNPNIAAKHEAIIASIMHREKAQGAGKLPKATKVPGVANPNDYQARYQHLLKHFPAGWSETREVAARWGVTVCSARNVLNRMLTKRLVKSAMRGGKRIWSAAL